MDRLTYPRKFLLISVLFGIPLALATYFLFGEINDSLERRYRAGLRDDRGHRLRRTLGLRRHRHGDEPGRAPVRRGQGGPDPRLAPRGQLRRSARRRRARGRAHAEGIRPPRSRLAGDRSQARVLTALRLPRTPGC